ncbi:hypothetical protein FVE67_02240 [Thermosulfurimonas marina]|uniref:Tetrahaem cytochrome domain-containing protein n=1 Tax=Thermosulfurimonas marina TaxID=2047767 RepID=A0A6H1WRA3_9BACT|nr:cytochrome c3 family protein [Thermosulfurimonas marina]QJA05689.1 hypothetical protein FVE67_02240 [Thermosulfurimonas marina]
MSERPNRTHAKRIVLGLILLIVLGAVVRSLLVPDDFGNHGSLFYKFYRKGAIQDELSRSPRHLTNASCESCHPWEYQLQSHSKHRTLSCEFCHGPWADHVNAQGQVIGALPNPTDKQAIKALCLRCHNRAIRARPRDPKVIKTVLLPDHLRQKHVREDHACDQCHLVHAPLYYINQMKAIWQNLLKGATGE